MLEDELIAGENQVDQLGGGQDAHYRNRPSSDLTPAFDGPKCQEIRRRFAGREPADGCRACDGSGYVYVVRDGVKGVLCDQHGRPVRCNHT